MEDRAISLNAVLDVMHEMWGDSGELLDAIKELPPVTPQPKTGHWIVKGSHDTYYGLDDYDCSECESHVSVEGDEPYHYCPYCGAKMVEPQESEE